VYTVRDRRSHPRADQRTPTPLIIWGALVAGVSTFFALSLVVPPTGRAASRDFADLLLAVACALTIVTIALSWLWPVRARLNAAPNAAMTGDALARARLIIASALCEGSALFALVVQLGTRDVRTMIPFAISFAALLVHFPSDRHWAKLLESSPQRVGGNRMMREYASRLLMPRLRHLMAGTRERR
jgi:hypothetical protein